MSKNLLKRLIVSAVGIPSLIFIIYKGGLLLYAFCLLVAFLGSWEMAAMLLAKKIQISKKLATVLSLGIITSFQFLRIEDAGLLIFALILIGAGYLKLLEEGVRDYTSKFSLALFTAVYPSFLMSFAILIRRDLPDIGWVILLMIFVNTWIADTFAYAFGKAFGKKKLAPTISPNKTWVGFIFAFPGGALSALGAFALVNGQCSLTLLLIASVAATLFGQIGDLVESAIKRDCDVKDSSSLIPGHGGVLDRFDSLLFALPTIYFIFRFVHI